MSEEAERTASFVPVHPTKSLLVCHNDETEGHTPGNSREKKFCIDEKSRLWTSASRLPVRRQRSAYSTILFSGRGEATSGVAGTATHSGENWASNVNRSLIMCVVPARSLLVFSFVGANISLGRTKGQEKRSREGRGHTLCSIRFARSACFIHRIPFYRPGKIPLS